MLKLETPLITSIVVVWPIFALESLEEIILGTTDVFQTT